MKYDDGVVEAMTAGTDSPESLTDTEKRIFLAAMEREKQICQGVDNVFKEYDGQIPLVPVCNEILRKVKAALWGN